MPEEVLCGSLKLLSSLLHRHYGTKVILLIDEYDVPLDKAQQYGYYEEMVALLRTMFGLALKTNNSLQFAVLTGCLRIAKESIFTGLNNLKARSVMDVPFCGYFGFTGTEVKDMLKYYGLTEQHAQIREWYDGYRFGDTDLYCPWDVLNHADLLRSQPDAKPQAYWMNSSGNAILRTLLQKAAPQTRRELEALVNGECVTKKISQEPTYRELYDSIDNLWSVLFTTGYLTWREETDRNTYRLAILNREIWEEETGIVIEIKYPDNGDLEAGCREALEQIERKRYAERLMQDGMKTIHKYGIACYKKSCKVQLGKIG